MEALKCFGERYAAVYDILYAEKDYVGECDFLEQVFKRFAQRRPRRILDLACGTGGHAIPLAGRGYQVTGVDVSEAMVEIARRKAGTLPIEFHVMDMRRLSLEGDYDAAICMFSGLSYLVSYGALREALHRVIDRLVRNGLFVFDVWNAAAVLSRPPRVEVREAKVGVRSVIRISEPRLMVDESLCEVTFKCLVVKRKRVEAIFEETHVLRYYLPQEIRHHLEDAGFKVLHMCPPMDLRGRIDEARDLTVIAIS